MKHESAQVQSHKETLKKSYWGGGGEGSNKDKSADFQYTTKKEDANKCPALLLCTLSTRGRIRSSEYRTVAKGMEVMCQQNFLQVMMALESIAWEKIQQSHNWTIFRTGGRKNCQKLYASNNHQKCHGAGGWTGMTSRDAFQAALF